MSRAYHWIHRVWYGKAASGFVLIPLSGIYWLIIQIRKLLYGAGIFSTEKVAVPVIVVGNITAGGTGKTPVVIWLVDALRRRGFSPGIVSRGYGGTSSGTSMRVDSDSDAAVAGDEPVLLSRRGKCPVAVDSDRIRAASMLIDDGVDVIVSDDGLQHLRLHRDFEICVVDGIRGLGNERLLPAGPLRESKHRLASVDQVLINGADAQDALRFDLQAVEACRLNGSLVRPLPGFKGVTVHAVAGIGHPQRFFDMLRTFGVQVIEHSFPDHAVLAARDLEFGDEFDVLMTEKDAVKLKRNVADKFWSVPVDLEMSEEGERLLMDRLTQRLAKGESKT